MKDGEQTNSFTKMKSRILIVGAGPAGVSTALFLAKNNIPSTLIDKEFFPRDKICGDGLSGWVISMLHKLDMGLVEELTAESGSLDSWGIKFYSPNMKHLTIPYQFHKRPNDAPGFIIRRKEFDNLLIKKVKENPLISLHEGVKITEYNTNNEGLELKDESGKKTFTGDMVVFADGATSRFAKNPGGFKKDDRHFATGLRVYYRGLKGYGLGIKEETIRVKDKDTDEGVGVRGGENGARNAVEFYFLRSILPGYFWIFPLPNGDANVGVGISTQVMKKKKINLKTELFRAISDIPELKERFKDAEQVGPVQAWSLPLGSKKQSLSGDRFLLAGDAASLIDPSTGEGVGNAMNSGFHAAEHLADCLNQNSFDAAFNKKYDTRIYDKLWNELKLSTSIQKLMARRRLFNFLFNRAVKSEYLRKSLTRMIDNLDERKKLKNPIYYLRVLIGK